MQEPDMIFATTARGRLQVRYRKQAHLSAIQSRPRRETLIQLTATLVESLLMRTRLLLPQVDACHQTRNRA